MEPDQEEIDGQSWTTTNRFGVLAGHELTDGQSRGEIATSLPPSEPTGCPDKSKNFIRWQPFTYEEMLFNVFAEMLSRCRHPEICWEQRIDLVSRDNLDVSEHLSARAAGGDCSTEGERHQPALCQFLKHGGDLT